MNSASNPYQTRERLWWLAASGRPNPRPRELGTGPRHSFCRWKHWKKKMCKKLKIEEKKRKGKRGKALLFHRFLLMSLLDIFWMLHCIYLKSLYLHMSIRFCHILLWISNKVKPRLINSWGGSLGQRIIFSANPRFMFHVSFLDQLNVQSGATTPGLTFLGTVS